VTAASAGVRLSAGSLKGRSVPVPAGVRPTEGRVREALFDILGPGLRGGRFLDLFAGSGAVGLEALSRGAGEVLQVDVDGATVRRLDRCYAAFGLAGVSACRLELPRQLDRLPKRHFDWVFADPPYAFAAYDELVAALDAVLASRGLAVVEHSRRVALPERVERLTREDCRVYGETALSFYRQPAGS
jgi:16S rRNA (guanine966-N2)-methyltransferase